MDSCDLCNKDIKITVLKNLKELQEDTERKLNKIKKIIQEQNKKYNKEREFI